MNLSYAWLTELVEFNLSPTELAEKLNAVGCAIEATEKLPHGDTRLVAEITSNRGDWLGHFGVAREISAITGKPIKFPPINLREKNIGELTSVTVERADLCPRYVARIIKGVKIGDSPKWLQDKLIAVGLRPINNIVDVTNLILYEGAQPLHAFDFHLLAGKKIIVRLARRGEKLTALTGVECTLDESMLVIADAEKPVAIAGVMGGAHSEVTAKTTDILLEAACFAPTTVRSTGQKLKLTSDSSYRFERGVDVGFVERASARAAQLISEIAGGEIYGVIDKYSAPTAQKEITLRYSACQRLLGYEITPAEIAKIFAGLGLEKINADAEKITVRVPTCRRDLEREVDLIEEVLRLSGFARVPTGYWQMPLMPMTENKIFADERKARAMLASLGYHECVTDSFIPEKWEDVTNSVRIENPVDCGRPVLRQSLISSLLDKRRVNRHEKNLGLFEINTIYRENPRGEKLALAIIDDRDIEYVRGALEQVKRALQITGVLTIKRTDDLPQYLQSSSVFIGDKKIGFIAQITPAQKKIHDLDCQPMIGEIIFDDLSSLNCSARVFTPLPRFPGIRRDLALVVPEKITWEEIASAANEIQKLDYHVESIYRGKGIDAGKKCVAFTFTYFAENKTLTDDEANAQRDELLKHLLNKISDAKLR